MKFQAKKTDRKLHRVALMVSVKDVKMTDLENGNVLFDFSIYRFENSRILPIILMHFLLQDLLLLR